MLNYEILQEDCGQIWEDYIRHDFVQQLRKGTLDKKNVQRYLCQDYVFLIQYAKA